jgi:hypothetical protein
MSKQKIKKYFFGIALIVVLIIIANFLQTVSEIVIAENNSDKSSDNLVNINNLREQVLPSDGVIIPVIWGSLGLDMIKTGVIDSPKFEGLYERGGGLSEYSKNLLYSGDNKEIKITKENSRVLLNLLWAFGLSNKNEILENGPMTDDKYGGDPSQFASTGGWSISVGSPMEHYSKHSFVLLTEEQQKRVKNVAKGIYRPCCGNSTYFPDCNHGMAMLGLLQLLAVQGLSEEEMFDIALSVNSYWFPETYLTIATYFEKQGVSWEEVDPKMVLGVDYSSSSGYRRILEKVVPVESQSGGDCGV